MGSSPPRGVNDIYVYTPEHKLTAEEFAEDSDKFVGLLKHGLGLSEKSVNEPSQDTIALAMNALEGLIEVVGQEETRYLYCGTESQLNLSKPVATNLMDLLDNKNVMTLDGVFACLSGLNLLVNGLGIGDGFVVTSDIAKYERKKGDSADFTGASGSVAVRTGEGKLLKVDSDFGAFSSNEWDFHKPIEVRGDELSSNVSPKVDGYFSFAAYVKHIGEAYKDLKDRKNIKLDDFNQVTFHVPYPGITKYALAYLRAVELEATDEIDEKLESIKDLFHNKDSDENYEASLKVAYTDIKGDLKEFMGDLEKLTPSLKYPSMMGNIYTGSVFLSLASALKHGDYDAGDNILVIGYGSGSGSTAVIMTTTDQTRKIADAWDFDERLSNRKSLSLSDYNSFRNEGVMPNNKPHTSSNWHLDKITEFGRRIYSKVKRSSAV
ncbi:MAG: hydroxymethylglutaryl-CoA synthase family protein [Candidatus Altiarchaeota archaeon]|nr:hydroxymethylglutaryl-CoA synthase family protein [Candidatus Altiarchaeota archaeon]